MLTTLDFTKPHVLRSAAEYDAAVARIDALLDQDPAPGSEDAEQLEFLAVLVKAYDDAHTRFAEGDVSPQAVVAFMLEQRGLTRADLVPLLKTPSRVSEFFSGARPTLSIGQIKALRRELGIPADLLIR